MENYTYSSTNSVASEKADLNVSISNINTIYFRNNLKIPNLCFIIMFNKMENKRKFKLGGFF